MLGGSRTFHTHEHPSDHLLLKTEKAQPNNNTALHCVSSYLTARYLPHPLNTRCTIIASQHLFGIFFLLADNGFNHGLRNTWCRYIQVSFFRKYQAAESTPSPGPAQQLSFLPQGSFECQLFTTRDRERMPDACKWGGSTRS